MIDRDRLNGSRWDIFMPSRVMLVEDDANIALLIRYNLEALGFLVDHAERGDVVEQQLAKLDPDLLLLDWTLPGVSGIELCRRIRAELKPSRLPIVFITARATKADRDYALSCGADDVIVKPFTVAELLARITALLPTRHLPVCRPPL